VRAGDVRTWVLGLGVALTLSTGSAQAGAAAQQKPGPAPEYYVSLGDSYGAGYQPVASAFHGQDSHGFAYQVVGLAAAKGYRFVLENFACSGATTTSILGETGCPLRAAGPDTVAHPTRTQAAAAERFITRHRGHIGLITVSIGGNDFFACSIDDIRQSCVAAAMAVAKTNLATLLDGLRHAAGWKVPIVGTTYPDVYLPQYNSTKPILRNLATFSIPDFRTQVNPTLKAAYDAVGAHFVDVTAATGAYIPLSRTTSSGSVPVAVADACSFTYVCTFGDIHPTTRGYALIARLVVETLSEKR